MVRKGRFLVAICLPLVLLTGCWDSQDPEDLEYIITLGIDKAAEGGCTFSMAPAKTQEKDPTLLVSSGRTLADALATTNSKNPRRAALGQLKMVIFGKSLLEDKEALQGILDELGRSQEVSGKVMVLGTGATAENCLEKLMEQDNGTGLFLWDFYKNTAAEVATTKGLDLETFYIELTEQKGAGVLPCITPTEDALALNKGVALKEGKFHFLMEEKIERGYLFLLGEGEGAILEGEKEGRVIPLRVVGNKASYDIKQEINGKVHCQIKIKIEGDLLGMGTGVVFSKETAKDLEKIFSALIKSEIENTIAVAKEQDAPEAYGIPSRIRQEIPTFSGDFWEDVIIEIQPEIKIRDTGRIR